MAILRRPGPFLVIVTLMLLSLLFLLMPDERSKVRFQASSFNWTGVPQAHPVSSIKPLPTGAPLPLPRVQYDFPRGRRDPTARARQRAVRDVFLRCWRSYKKYAWGDDELLPVSGGSTTTYGGWGVTMVDALDTLWIMGLHGEFYAAAAAVARLDWANTTYTSISLFETTIRHLGGLISAHDLSGEPALLQKATELGEMLYMAFDTPNRLPAVDFSFADARSGAQLAGDADPAAGPTSLSLEFTRLAQLTGDAKFFDAVDRVTQFLAATQNRTLVPGLWPRAVNFRAGAASPDAGDATFSLGADCDSLYEYLPKMHALLGGLDGGGTYETLYRRAMDAAVEHLLFRPMLPGGEDVLFAGDASVFAGKVGGLPRGQHLGCFAGGLFGLGGKLFGIDDHVGIGGRLARGCAWAYGAFPTGVMPEQFAMVPCDSLDGPCPWDEARWQREGDASLPRGFTGVEDPRYLLRPEAIESVFLLYRMTGDEDLQDIAWRMFESVVNATETEYANSEIANVTVTGRTVKTDSMQVSFSHFHSCAVAMRGCGDQRLTDVVRVSGCPRH